MVADQDASFCISPLVKAECLAGVVRARNVILETAYTRQFTHLPTLQIVEATFMLAARIRGNFGLKMSDALHVACAQENGCSELWTNDSRMAAAAPGLTRNILAEA
jgi:predicted nucleic acid-binding protein